MASQCELTVKDAEKAYNDARNTHAWAQSQAEELAGKLKAQGVDAEAVHTAAKEAGAKIAASRKANRASMADEPVSKHDDDVINAHMNGSAE